MIDPTVAAGVILASALATSVYRRLALVRGVIAKVTFRSLHTTAIPRGAGIAFAAVFTGAVLWAFASGRLPVWMAVAWGVGGGAAAVVGFWDDLREIPAAVKLGAQTILALGLFLVLYQPVYASHVPADFLPRLAMAAVLTFVPVWLINLYNFIDGVDGMAIMGAIFICAAATTVLMLTGGDPAFVLIATLLGSVCLGFAWFNLPPANIFMGDAGSIFLGYSVSALVLATVLSGQINGWTWAAILAYFLADTTVTGLYRLLFVRNWYGVHRSHAYQHLAKSHGHAMVTYGVVAYNLFWALPLAVWSALVPAIAPLAAVLSIAPALAWAYRFGPRLSVG